MGVRFLFIGTLPLCLVSSVDCARAQAASGNSEVSAGDRGRRPDYSRQAGPQQRRASDGRQELAQGFCLPDGADADGRFGNGCRQGAGKHQRGGGRADRAYRVAEHRGCAAATGTGNPHQRHDRQSISAGHPIPRVRRIAGSRYASGTCGLPERGACQRGVRRHRQLGPDSDGRDQVGYRRNQQPRVRPQRARRGRQRPDEGRL